MGYAFLGWFDQNNNYVNTISKGTTGNLILTAHWNDGNAYQVQLDPNGGSISNLSLNFQFDHEYSLPEPTRSGYLFEGWYDDSTKISNSGIWRYPSDMELVAHWAIINYSISYTLNGGTNSENNPSSYTVEDSITLASPNRMGYAFLGWFDQCDNQITSIFEGTTGNISLSAKWSANLNNLSITSEDNNKGTVAVISGSGYSDESITVTATPIGDYVLKGWYHDSVKVSDDTTYTFTMPTNDYSLVAKFFTAEEKWNVEHGVTPNVSVDGTTLTYGLYPQTNINNASLIASLNALLAPESNGWYLYNNEYYAKIIASPNDANYQFDNGDAIVSGETYWFKCEPITWDVLSNNDGRYYLLSSMLLDAHCFYNQVTNRTVEGITIYPNNYEYSDIRNWLNNEFLNSAFALNNTFIQNTNVDNSAPTTNSSVNPYACNNTTDKVFLPSYQDYINSDYGFVTSTGASNTRCSRTTDFARARGSKYYTLGDYNGHYWMRSPSSDRAQSAWRVGDDGYINRNYVDYSFYSVRPCLNINI